MTHDEFTLLVGKLQELWPNWRANEQEREIWQEKVGWARYDDARQAVKECYAEQPGNRSRPSLREFKARLQALSRAPAGQQRLEQPGLPEPTHEVVCLEAPPGLDWMLNWSFCVYPRPYRQDSCPNGAGDWERLCIVAASKCQEVYGGGIWAVRERQSILPGPKGSMAEAVERILAGPDTPGRRFILAQQQAMAAKHPAPSRRQECMFEGQAPSAPTKPQVAAQEPEDEFDRFIREHKGVDDSLPF